MAEMRQLHIYDCALMDKLPMRVFLATMVVAGSFAVALIVVIPAYGEPETCPGICDRIPNTAWIDQHAVPLDAVYHWPALAGQAAHTTGAAPGELCGAPALPQDPRDSAVVARSTVAHPDGQWQLQAQVLHWRGDTAHGGAVAATVRGCQQRAPQESPSLTSDEPTRMAAVISGPVVMHTYLLAHPASSTISELTLWSSAPPQTPWPAMADDPVLGAMNASLCEAYIASCP